MRFFRSPDAQTRLFAVVDSREECYNVSIVDNTGAVYLSVEGYQTSALPGGIDEGKNAVLKALFERD